MEIHEKAQKMLEKYPLCNHCLGRQFALLGHEMNNQKRGEVLKTILTFAGHRSVSFGEKKGISLLKILAVNGAFYMATGILRRMGKKVGRKKSCYLCNDQFKSLDNLAEKTVDKLLDYEYANFLVGIRLPTVVEESGDEFKAEFSVQHGENIRNEFSREIGKRISIITGKEAEYKKPDITIIINPFTKKIMIQTNPIYIAGRYKKLILGIPQSKRPCRECSGEGCSRCNWTGKMHPDSVEEIIAEPTLEHSKGKTAVLHTTGKDDTDIRQFIIEVKRPIKRFIDLKALKEAINKRAEEKLRAMDLRFTKRDAVRKLKKKGAETIYRAKVEFERGITDEEQNLLEKSLTSTIIRQQTSPVSPQMTDRIREKYIYETKIKRLTPKHLELMIRCEGGLSVKDLITGDEGRTDLSVSKVLGVKASLLELDALNIIEEHIKK
ncbi:MAG: tRNA pseudouridine(54/55) synthase Pus10 [Candidatus Aerophobus sp.]|nr:MAG: tRNA pseudouridine(54/55) synthase Pus10 [Candidatus Aerophobus sp.]